MTAQAAFSVTHLSGVRRKNAPKCLFYKGFVHFRSGAGNGNRTRVTSLEGWHSAPELCPQKQRIAVYHNRDTACNCKLRGKAAKSAFTRAWRRGGDSNPRYGCPYATFPRWYLKPLRHLSVAVFEVYEIRPWISTTNSHLALFADLPK